eukprot:1178867-Prorocentrum_minimum.AAC.1
MYNTGQVRKRGQRQPRRVEQQRRGPAKPRGGASSTDGLRGIYDSLAKKHAGKLDEENAKALFEYLRVQP